MVFSDFREPRFGVAEKKVYRSQLCLIEITSILKWIKILLKSFDKDK